MKKTESYTSFVIQNKKTGMYIAIDSSSGGYPYQVEIDQAHRFRTDNEPLRYKEVMGSQAIDWVIGKVVAKITFEAEFSEI